MVREPRLLHVNCMSDSRIIVSFGIFVLYGLFIFILEKKNKIKRTYSLRLNQS